MTPARPRQGDSQAVKMAPCSLLQGLQPAQGSLAYARQHCRNQRNPCAERDLDPSMLQFPALPSSALSMDETPGAMVVLQIATLLLPTFKVA